MGIATGALGLTGLGLGATSAQAADQIPPAQAVGSAPATQGNKPPGEQPAHTEGYVIPLEEFTEHLDAKNPLVLDASDPSMEGRRKATKEELPPDSDGLRWDTDGCSGGGQRARKSCDRHDFNHRNAVEQRCWSREVLDKIDKQFRDDLDSQVKRGELTAGETYKYQAGVWVYSYVPTALGGYEPWDTTGCPNTN